MKTLTRTDELVRLEDVPELDGETVVRWHEEHLNPALIALMRFGGYDRVRIVRAEGAYLYDDRGRRLLDLVSSYGALNHGHNHPRLVRAARWIDEREPADLLKEFPSPWTAALARNLTRVAPGDLDFVFLCNSGTEAIEGALKLALRASGGRRDRFVYAEGSLHGKTLGSLSVTGREKYRAHVRRFEDWPMVPFGDLEALERVLAEDREHRIAGLLLEPIQGEGGVRVPPRGYLKAAAERVRAHGALLILDEVQTGLGRTGTLFRCQAEDVVPDVLCLAKSLGGGLATIGATLTRRAIHGAAYGTLESCLVHTSTFGGRARAAGLALEALNVTLEEDLPGRAARLGATLRAGLERVRERHPGLVRAVRGEGLMLGVELQEVELGGFASPLGAAGIDRLLRTHLPGMIGAELLQHHGVVASFLLNHPRVLRVYPALVASEQDLEQVPRALDAVLSKGLGRIVAERVAFAVRHAGLGAVRKLIGGDR